MPWCDGCDRFYNPNTAQADGTCPTCGRQLGQPARPATKTAPKVPWHFWLFVVAAGLYLGWRAIEGVVWVVQHL